MTAIDLAPPPVAEIGHNSRIEKAAREIQKRAAFLAANLHENTWRRQQILSSAGASGMESAKFHVLWCYLEHGNRDGENIYVSEKTIAEIVGKGESTVRRLTKELEKEGWLPETKKGRRDAATRAATIPQRSMQAIISEMVAQAKAEGRPVVIPNMKPDRENNQDRSELSGQGIKTAQICELRPLNSDQQENLKIEPNNKSSSARTHTREEVDRLTAKLFEAGGDKLNRGHVGFLSLGEVFRWLEGGCDLDLDVIPTVRRIAASRRDGHRQITGWAYFTAAVIEARDLRLSPLPAAQTARGSPRFPAEKPSENEKKIREMRALGVKI